MVKSGNITTQTDGDVSAFVAKIGDTTRREDADALIALFSRVSGEPPKMWGPSIIGFGSYHYVYDSGREGDMCRTGFSPRKGNFALYLKGEFERPEAKAVLAQLGKHKTGKGCLYINRLADVDMGVLEKIIGETNAYMAEKYPV